MSDLIDTTEMYLKAILELEEDGQVPMRARISERLDHSGPTVSQTVARMERDGLLTLAEDKQLVLTEEGRRTAVEVMRKHRLAELLLAEVIGLEWEHLHDEACRWEHVMSERVELKLLELLKNPRISPFGIPVPGLELLGVAGATIADAVALSSLESSTTAGELQRIGEPIQVDPELLVQFRQLGILPGRILEISYRSGEWLLMAPGATEGLLVSAEIAQHLFFVISS
jgi:DtxR family transcriptional regulator, Mn-dependent transcriptional regulator